MAPAVAKVTRHSQPTSGATSDRIDMTPGSRKCMETA